MDGEDDPEDSVWSQDIEEAFEEALEIYPPCGRRKIVLSDEGKMYGRNELIARYIMMRTGKTRSRKQVSSHIQVLARKKQRESPGAAGVGGHSGGGGGRGRGGGGDGGGRGGEFHMMSSGRPALMSDSAAARSSGAAMGAGGASHEIPIGSLSEELARANIEISMTKLACYIQDHRGSDHHFALIDSLRSFTDPNLEHVDILQIYDKFPGLREHYAQGHKPAFFLVKFWVDLDYHSSLQGFHGLDVIYESTKAFPLELSTCVYSLGKQVVEKVQTEPPACEDGKYYYRFQRSPLCAYMLAFVEKLHALKNLDQMNAVLENFSILQTVRDKATENIIFSSAYLFETATPGNGAQHRCYKLIDAVADSIN